MDRETLSRPICGRQSLRRRVSYVEWTPGNSSCPGRASPLNIGINLPKQTVCPGVNSTELQPKRRRNLLPELRKSLIGGAGVLGAVALGAAPLLAPGTSIGKPSSQGKTTKPLHRVYAESNDTKNNQVVVFSRAADGTLKKIRSVATGGKGCDQAEPGCPAPCPILDTQGEVALANAKKLLFAVNAGSNSISTFQVTRGGLKLRSVTPSRGV